MGAGMVHKIVAGRVKTMPKFEDMNETDVREIVVRPLLARLGYEHGTTANIRTEQTFRYERAFLGRKNPAKDPPLIGRADYILEIASIGRWVVEVKGPNEELSRDVVEQAHTYAAHPEVAAIFFLVTNGRSFRLYRTSALDAPLMAWDYDDTDEVFLALLNLVGPEAIRRKMELLKPDKGKPLAPNLGSVVQIIGGWFQYEDHAGSHPLIGADAVNGLRMPVTGGSVSRADDGRLYANLKTAKAFPLMGEMADLIESHDGYDYFSSDEYVSLDREKPTIFQNFIQSETPAGTQMNFPGFGTLAAPFAFRYAARTEAVGFVEGDTFKGTMQLEYRFQFRDMSSMIRAGLEAQFGPIPETMTASGGGMFEVKLLLQ